MSTVLTARLLSGPCVGLVVTVARETGVLVAVSHDARVSDVVLVLAVPPAGESHVIDVRHVLVPAGTTVEIHGQE